MREGGLKRRKRGTEKRKRKEKSSETALET